MTQNNSSNNQSEQSQLITSPQSQKLPVGENEDVEFASEQADAEDLEAVMRANAADQRQQEEDSSL